MTKLSFRLAYINVLGEFIKLDASFLLLSSIMTGASKELLYRELSIKRKKF